MPKDAKVVVVGAGRVGSTFASTLANSGLVQEIVLADSDLARAEGEAMDIVHAVPFHRPVQVRAGTLQDAAGAMVTVITAGAAQTPGQPRPELLARNWGVLRPIIEELVRVNPGGLLLVTTNPVDALTLAALRTSKLPRRQVIGSGTLLDSARLRSELAALCRVDARNVHAYVLGEHGDSEVVAWSTAQVASMGLSAYCAEMGIRCHAEDLDAVAARVRTAADEIIRRKGATNFAIASALTRIIEAVVRDECSVLTVSTWVDGPYGIRDVCLSLPAVVDGSGAGRVLPPALSSTEVEALQRSAEAIRRSLAALSL